MSSLTISEMFAIAAQRLPDKSAIHASGATTSYEALATWVRTGAQSIREEFGLGSGDRVLVMASNSAAFLTSVLACAAAGAVVVPVSTQLTPRELAYIIGDCSPRLVLHGAEYEQTVLDALGQARPVDTPPVREITEFATDNRRAHLTGAVWDAPSPDDLIYLGYTSGTTGAPKGVKVSHRNRVQSILLQASEFQLGRRDTHLAVSPLYHTAPLTFALLHLCLGGAVVVSPAFDAAQVATELCSNRVTNTFLAPSALQRVLTALPPGHEPSVGLHAVIIGGAPCPAQVKSEALRRLPDRLWEFYGATEVGIVTTLRPREQTDRPRSAGRLLPGAHIEVRDLETGEPVTSGQVGKVWITTATTSEGYLGVEADPNADPMRFIGDVGFVDDRGFLHLVDRSADIIITGGVNVYSREVEAVIERHPRVVDVAVFGVPDETWGEAVVAAVAVSAPLDGGDLVEFCRESLAGFKRPRSIVFVPALPRSQTGKTDKRRLREQFLTSQGSTTQPIA